MLYSLYVSYMKSTLCKQAYIDLEKGFDRVPWNVIWLVIQNLGTEEWLVRLIQSMHINMRSSVRVGDGYSEKFGMGVVFIRDLS